jgi:hypothetical protein
MNRNGKRYTKIWRVSAEPVAPLSQKGDESRYPERREEETLLCFQERAAAHCQAQSLAPGTQTPVATRVAAKTVMDQQHMDGP